MNTTKKNIDNLYSDIMSYINSCDYVEILEFITKFPYLSSFNAIMTRIQMPGASYVLSRKKWKDYYKCEVKENAKPILILIPFSPLGIVYDISDVDNIDKIRFIEELKNPFSVKGKLSPSVYYNLIYNLKFHGVMLEESNEMGSNLAGYIYKNNDIKQISIMYNSRKKTKEIILPIYFTISINPKASIEEKFTTITHELGHLFCHHISHEVINEKRTNLDTSVEEFEAETVSYILSKRYDLQTKSNIYLSSYLTKKNKIPNIDLNIVLKAEETIRQMTKKRQSIKDGLLYEKDPFVKKQLI